MNHNMTQHLHFRCSRSTVLGSGHSVQSISVIDEVRRTNLTSSLVYLLEKLSVYLNKALILLNLLLPASHLSTDEGAISRF